jgi:ribose/xylose/arabinose/galactoside ABC-type transport system permease subunit
MSTEISPVSVAPAAVVEAGSSRRATRARLVRWGAVSVGLVLLIVLGATTSGYLTLDNGKAVLASSAVVGILAIGETIIMISGNLFSLSIAATSAVAAMAFVSELRHGLVLAIVAAILVGTVTSAIQGFLIGRWRANPIIVTIAAASLMEGVGSQLTGSQELVPPAGHTSYLDLVNPIAGIPISVFIFIGIAVIVELILRRTSFGVSVYLVGDNRQAARAAALPVTRLVTGVFLLSGLMAGIAGVLLVSINRDASLSLEGSNTYNAIAATLVGGTLVSGGRGSITRTVFGCLVISAVADLVVLRGYTTGIQALVQGVLVVIAVVIVRITSRVDA